MKEFHTQEFNYPHSYVERTKAIAADILHDKPCNPLLLLVDFDYISSPVFAKLDFSFLAASVVLSLQDKEKGIKRSAKAHLEEIEKDFFSDLWREFVKNYIELSRRGLGPRLQGFKIQNITNIFNKTANEFYDYFNSYESTMNYDTNGKLYYFNPEFFKTRQHGSIEKLRVIENENRKVYVDLDGFEFFVNWDNLSPKEEKDIDTFLNMTTDKRKESKETLKGYFSFLVKNAGHKAELDGGYKLGDILSEYLKLALRYIAN
ncbi:hypothetical protein [Helicobacter sp. 11S02629-2]|uniref:hypothetical protein n=1 Tax=Helicobacter sp. 11S02629-2 TaxID=1476195 RepID=UPI000BA6D6DA|nr:hypothetical protein [Helicobacter sp. 11S02629-2]PAF45951.1 hypothetical protein BKH40_00640 [Helicobacter sp. 11S02629-2]